LLTDWDKISNLYKGPSINASYQVSVHLAKRFQRRRFFKNSANQKQELPVTTMFVNGSGQNVQSLERTFYRCFLPSFSSFGWGVSEEKIKMWKVNGRQTTDDKLTLLLARWANDFCVAIKKLGESWTTLKKTTELTNILSWRNLDYLCPHYKSNILLYSDILRQLNFYLNCDFGIFVRQFKIFTLIVTLVSLWDSLRFLP
jgi:hypothetical protein